MVSCDRSSQRQAIHIFQQCEHSKERARLERHTMCQQLPPSQFNLNTEKHLKLSKENASQHYGGRSKGAPSTTVKSERRDHQILSKHPQVDPNVPHTSSKPTCQTSSISTEEKHLKPIQGTLSHDTHVSNRSNQIRQQDQAQRQSFNDCINPSAKPPSKRH